MANKPRKPNASLDRPRRVYADFTEGVIEIGEAIQKGFDAARDARSLRDQPDAVDAESHSPAANAVSRSSSGGADSPWLFAAWTWMTGEMAVRIERANGIFESFVKS